MARFFILSVLVGVSLAGGRVAEAQPSLTGPPVTYEVLINGESFQVEGNQRTKLESKEKPGTVYDIAVRVSPTQMLRMNSVRLEYELPAKVIDDRGKETRTLLIRHELGFTIQVKDLGQALTAEQQAAALKAVTEFATQNVVGQKAEELKASDPIPRKFAGSAGQVVSIHYQDPKGFGHVCLACVLGGETFTTTCVIDYQERDREDVLPMIKKTLDSIRALR